MIGYRVIRICPKTGERQPAIRDKNGFFVLGAPELGNEKHKSATKILIRDEDEMMSRVVAGHSIRVRTKRVPSLVNRNLIVDGRAIR